MTITFIRGQHKSGKSSVLQGLLMVECARQKVIPPRLENQSMLRVIKISPTLFCTEENSLKHLRKKMHALGVHDYHLFVEWTCGRLPGKKQLPGTMRVITVELK